ncbi:MAG: AAA family ATPase [Bradymonadales bacterium]|nr:AAA family ATPase [Bradymonadales bacterium]
MTDNPAINPFAFPSNEAYLGWEMTRLMHRVQALIGVKSDPSTLVQFHELVNLLQSTRPAAMEMRHAAYQAGVDIPFDAISRRFHLRPEDEEILMICMAPHLSNYVWGLLLHAQGTVLKPYLEVGFIADLFQPSTTLLTRRTWCEPDSPLIRHGLIVLDQPSQPGVPPVSLLAHSVQAPHYLAAAVTGRPVLDERVVPFCSLFQPTVELFDIILSLNNRQRVEEFVRGFYRRSTLLEVDQKCWTLMISGPAGSGKSRLAEGLARAFNRQLFTVYLNRLARIEESIILLNRAFQNAQFLNALLLLVQPEQLLATYPGLLGPLLNLISSYHGLTVLEPRDVEQLPPLFESVIHFAIDIERTDAEEREQLWESLLPPQASLGQGVRLVDVASTFELTGGQIQSAIAWAQQRAKARGDDLQLDHDDLVAGAKSQIRSKIGTLTETSKVRLTMDDLILKEDAMKLVREFLDACRNRQQVMNEWGFAKRLITGKGLVALFTGEAGTGKTLTAEILANELDLQLRVVSIPKVVSKWVGETEKNIREIFTHARAQNSMLLFDEADSLFSTRVKVERAQDHYLNMEVDMFLQEIERFEGIVILTTNLEANIDRAFQRRILFKIDFPVPDEMERERIWKTLIPKQTPVEGEIDYGLLADAFELTGGQIKNAIIRAAYRCCSENHGLNQQYLEDAAQQQSKAAGRLIKPIDELRKQRASWIKSG